ncbi:MAG: hypothetical protein ACLFQB_13230 [Chitinispirillaceae bacterium]
MAYREANLEENQDDAVFRDDQVDTVMAGDETGIIQSVKTRKYL